MLAPVPIEQAVVKHLRDLLGIQVGTRVPRERPAEFLVVSRTGGGTANMVMSRPTALVESWATDPAVAWENAAAAWAHLNSSDETDLPGVWVSSVSLTEPVNFPDSATGTPRYQFIYSPLVSLKEIS